MASSFCTRYCHDKYEVILLSSLEFAYSEKREGQKPFLSHLDPRAIVLQFEDLPLVGAIRPDWQIALILFRTLLEEMTRVGDSRYGVLRTTDY